MNPSPASTQTEASVPLGEVTSSPDDAADESQPEASQVETCAKAGDAPRTSSPAVRAIAFVALPVIAFVLAGSVGFLKWHNGLAHDSDVAASETVQTATDSTVKMLSYRPETVDQDLRVAEGMMTGKFREDYEKLIHDVVIPGAKERRIAAVASVPAASSVAASPDHAVVLVFVNQTVTMGADPPTNTASSVRVTLDRIEGRWLVSAFDPV